MKIVVTGTEVTLDTCTLAFQNNNLVDTVSIIVDTDETWQYKLDVKFPTTDGKSDNLYNIIDLPREGNTCTVTLQAPMLPFRGRYIMQLRGISGDRVYHTNTFAVWVEYSIDPSNAYDPIPSEFYQIEQAVTKQAAEAKQSAAQSVEASMQSAEHATAAKRSEDNAKLYETGAKSAQVDADAANEAAQSSKERAEMAAQESEKSAVKSEKASEHSPKIGGNGNWFLWNSTVDSFVDTGISATGPEGQQGPQGPTGSPGPKGDPGITTMTQAAYDAAVAAGTIDADTWYGVFPEEG